MKIFLFLLLFITPAFAQQTVITKPFGVTTSLPATNTITSTDVFQTVFPAGNRSSCTIQNKGSNSMWVCFTSRSSCTKANSIKLSTEKSVGCIAGSVVLKDEVSVLGTSGDEFYAASQ